MHYQTARAYGKKPTEWYERIIELYDKGMNPHHIATTLGENPKSVYMFLRQHAIQTMTAEQRKARKRYRNEPPGPRPCNVNRSKKASTHGDREQANLQRS